MDNLNSQNNQNDGQQTVIVEKPKKKKRLWLKITAAVCGFAILTGVTLGTTNYLIDQFDDKEQKPQTTLAVADKPQASQTQDDNSSDIKVSELVNSNTTDVSDRENEITRVVENVMPSMVAINVIATQTVENNYGIFFGQGGSYEYDVTGSGSGIIIGENDTELLIVTNNHVVEGAKQIAIEFVDGESYNATIKGTDAEWDLAVVAVKLSELTAQTKSQIKIAVMGNSDNLMLGEYAIAIGNSLGYGQSVTVGYISATSRDVVFSDGTRTLIQTDAAINPGNSGGALLNINGEVIGINSAKYSSTDVEGMGYAIPITAASEVITNLMNSIVIPEEEKPFLGISGQTVPDSYQERFNWPAGVYIAAVTESSPASLVGINPGDIIIGFNGEEIRTQEDLEKAILSCKVGDKVEIVVAKSVGNGYFENQKVTAVLIARSDIAE